MLLYLDENRKILDNNFVISHASALKIMQENPLAEWHDIDFSFAMGEDRQGFEKAFYLETDGTIRIEYEKIKQIPIEPTQLDRIEAAVNMKNEEISEKAIDTYTKQLLESGLL